MKPLSTDLHLGAFQGLHMDDLPVAWFHYRPLWPRGFGCHCALEKRET